MDWTSVESITFFLAATVVLGGAMLVVSARNTVHAALGLVATLFGIAVLFLNQDAQFLAAVQVIVYTGAIVVLILFVIMLLGVDTDEDVDEEPLVGQRAVAWVVSLGVVGIVAGALLLVADGELTGTPAATAALDGTPNIEQIGRVLFTDYIFAVEVTALLLTVAVVGAVLLARRPRDPQPIPEPASMEPPEGLDADTDEDGH
jgi:NADH-quinone oxidoreductase subunit J